VSGEFILGKGGRESPELCEGTGVMTHWISNEKSADHIDALSSPSSS
jgi:hypothetical protein